MGTNQTIEFKVINTGTWYKIQIVSVSYGFSQTLKNGEWVNTTIEPQRQETEILTLGKYFNTNLDAEKFFTTKQFKSLFKNIKTNWV